MDALTPESLVEALSDFGEQATIRVIAHLGADPVGGGMGVQRGARLTRIGDSLHQVFRLTQGYAFGWSVLGGGGLWGARTNRERGERPDASSPLHRGPPIPWRLTTLAACQLVLGSFQERPSLYDPNRGATWAAR